MSYIYRRTDNDELIEVGFEEMMNQKDGFITLPDGVLAKRCIALELQKYGDEDTAKYEMLVPGGRPAPLVSDAMGVTYHQVDEMRQDAMAHKLNVEFVQDPTEPTFYQAKFNSRRDWEQYVAHRGMYDKNSINGSGAMLSPAQYQKAAELVERNLAEKFPQIPILASDG